MKLMNINRYGEAGVTFSEKPALPCDSRGEALEWRALPDSREPNSFAGFFEN